MIALPETPSRIEPCLLEQITPDLLDLINQPIVTAGERRIQNGPAPTGDGIEGHRGRHAG